MSDLLKMAREAARLSPNQRAAAMTVPQAKTKSDRGFGYIMWRDTYWQECRLSESSIATDERVWLGENDHCMHLDRKQALALSLLLGHFAETGKLP